MVSLTESAQAALIHVVKYSSFGLNFFKWFITEFEFWNQTHLIVKPGLTTHLAVWPQASRLGL